MIETTKKNIKTYSELIQFSTFEDRFNYLKLTGTVGVDTFGFDRYLNQLFYNSLEWKRIRRYIITRDNGCDLGVPGYDIYGRIYIHHINPLVIEDILDKTEYLLNPEYLISSSFDTHQAIHYGNTDRLRKDPIIRKQNDTCPWRH